MDPGMVKDLATGAIPPALIAGAGFAAMWFRSPSSDVPNAPARADRRLVATPLIMAAGTILAYILLLGVPRLIPGRALEWIPLIALGAGIAGAIAAIERLPTILRWLPALAVLIGAWWVSARNLIAHSWTLEQAAAELLEFILAGVVVMVAAHMLVRKPGFLGVLVLLLFAGATSQLLVLGYFSMTLGQIVGMSAAALGAGLCVVIWRPQFRLGDGTVVFVSVMVLTALLQGKLFGAGVVESERGYSALLVLSLVAAALVSLGLPLRMRPRMRGAAVILTLVLPLSVSLAHATKGWLAAGKEESGYGTQDMPSSGVSEPE